MDPERSPIFNLMSILKMSLSGPISRNVDCRSHDCTQSQLREELSQDGSRTFLWR